MECNEVLVSVICTAYNHEKYIKTALEGFVSQKTDFRFEVIVHDDASTDSTALIIKQYEKENPEIIKGIYQTDNQYSKGIDIFHDYLLPRINGKYVASCEGDDYWCDMNKLQKQVDFLEQNKDYSSCCSNSFVYDCKTGRQTVFNSRTDNHDVSLVEAIRSDKERSYQTATLMYRSEFARKRYIDNTPIWGILKHVGDYPLRIYLLMNGKTRYISDCMSVYRENVPGSWSDKHANNTLNEEIDDIASRIKCLKVVDDYTNFQCHQEVEKSINEYELILSCLTMDYEMYKRAISSEYYPYRTRGKTRAKLMLSSLYEKHWRRACKKNLSERWRNYTMGNK